MPTRTILALKATLGLFGILLSFGLALPAHAADYPLPTRAQGNVTTSTVHAGECTVFSGGGFKPGTPITVTDNGKVVGHTGADAKGDFSYKVCFPTDATLGTHELDANGVGANGAARTVFAKVTVIGVRTSRGDGGNNGGTGGGLPFTGSDVRTLVALGLLFVLLGALLVWRSTRERGLRRARRRLA